MKISMKKQCVLAMAAFGVSGSVFAAPVLDEIIVTAERREASIQDTAAAITAHTGATLEKMGVTSAEDLSVATPSLQTNSAGGNTQFYVRGVGSFGSNSFAEYAVSLNMDGVYVSRASTFQGLFYDLERIEVLKGPQGTLYGRNSTGGAVNLISRRPEIGGSVNGYVTVEAGSYDLYRVNSAVNIPVSDTFAMRAAVQKLDRDGYFDDGTDDADSTSVRLSGLYDNGGFSALVVADVQHVDQLGPGSTIVGPSSEISGDFLDTGDPWSAGALSAEVQQALANPARFPFIRGTFAQGTPNSLVPGYELDAYNIMAELNWETDAGHFTFLPAYRKSELTNINYNPGFLIDVLEKQEQTSLEFRWAQGLGDLEWVAGLYYYDESIDSLSFFLQDLPFFNQNNAFGLDTINSTVVDLGELGTESAAIFAEGTYALSDSLRLKLGARYTREDKTMEGTSLSTAPLPFPPFGIQTLVSLEGDNVDDDELTWKLGLEYDLNEENFVYFTVSTGFKAGGYYAEQAQFGNSFEPETITAYALGSKSTLLDGTLRLNAELFYWDYKDHQESHLANSPGGYSVFQTENIGNATMKGLDLEVDYLATPADRLSLQLQWLDAVFNDFNYTAFSPGGVPNVACPVAPMGGGNFTVDCDGFDAVRAPKWSFNLAYEHTFDLGEHGEMAFTLRTQVSDETYTSIDYLPAGLADNYTRTDLYLNYTSPSARWNLGLWARNLEDEAVITGAFVSPFTDLSFSSLRPPRTYGANIQYNF